MSLGKMFGVLALVATALGASAQGLLTNGSFAAGDQGWRYKPNQEVVETLKTGGRSGECLHMKSSNPNERELIFASQQVAGYKEHKPIRLSFWAKGKDVGLAGGVIQGLSEEGKIVSFATSQASHPFTGTFDWTRVETTLNATEDTANAVVLLYLSGKGEVWIDDVSIDPIDPATLPKVLTDGPGLIEAKGAFTYTAAAKVGETKLLIPIMLDYKEQAPLSYRFTATPKAKLVKTRLYEDRPGNYVAEVTLAPLNEKETVEIEWTSTMLVGQRSFDSLPDSAPFPAAWPAEAKPWLKSTRSVQAADKQIQAMAKKIRGNEKDVLKVITATLAQTLDIYEKQKGRCTSLDAVQALSKQGSCTSCANLVAALLRANDIPARILSGYPLWSGPLQTHYIVEAYVPGYGWYPLESTQLQQKWQLFNQVIVSIIPPEYEDKSETRAGGFSGVPYLSLTEYPDPKAQVYSMGSLNPEKTCDHVATRVQVFKDSPEKWAEALKLARAKWEAWLKSNPTELTMGADYKKTWSLDEVISTLKKDDSH